MRSPNIRNPKGKASFPRMEQARGNKNSTCEGVGEPEELALEPAQDPAPVEGGHEVEGEADGGNQELVEHLLSMS